MMSMSVSLRSCLLDCSAATDPSVLAAAPCSLFFCISLASKISLSLSLRDVSGVVFCVEAGNSKCWRSCATPLRKEIGHRGDDGSRRGSEDARNDAVIVHRSSTWASCTSTGDRNPPAACLSFWCLRRFFRVPVRVAR